MAAKTIVCRCEDVTLGDVDHAVALGYRHIEEVKRYTGLGTGPCGGKECMVPCALLLLAQGGPGPAEAEPFTSRPPIATILLGTLAAAEVVDGDDAPPAQAHTGGTASAGGGRGHVR